MQLLRTDHVCLAAHRCSACWKCLDACKAGVFSKIDLPWHKHVILGAPERCTGCRACIRQCEYGALTRTPERQGVEARAVSPVGLLANLGLLTSGLAAAISGLAIQLGFHVGAASHAVKPWMQTSAVGDLDLPAHTVGGLGRFQWAFVHKFSITILSLLLLQHILIHRSWYARLFRRGSRFGHPQLLWLTILMLLVAATGLVPWGLSLLGGSSHLRFILIEVHDKLALPLTILLLLHVVQRAWRFVPFVQLRGNR